MQKNMNDLVSDYETDAIYIAKLQSELNQAQERARDTLAALMGAHGKGPYKVNGKDVVVLKRKGTMCTMPAVRVRKNKKSNTTTDTSASASASANTDNDSDVEFNVVTTEDTYSDDSDSDTQAN
jgi:hypothetical protein